MSKYIFSDAMNGIPDDMLQEAMQVRKKSRTGWVVFRAAACLAVVIGLLMAAVFTDRTEDPVIGPGILSITAHAADGEIITITAPDQVQYGQFAVVSPLLGSPFVNAFTLSITDELSDTADVNFLLRFEGGVFRSGEQPGEMTQSEISVSNHSTVYWTMEEAVTVPGGNFEKHRATAYVDIIVYDGEAIIGYTVLRLKAMTCEEYAKIEGKKVAHKDNWLEVDPKDFIYCDGGDHLTGVYTIAMLESVYFPRVNGKYQEITLDYVDAYIAKTRTN